jgi:hypothetical protein
MKFCNACGAERPEYATYLCVQCTAQELVSKSFNHWLDSGGSLSAYGVDLKAGVESQFRRDLMPIVLLYLKEMDKRLFPQIRPEFTSCFSGNIYRWKCISGKYEIDME